MLHINKAYFELFQKKKQIAALNATLQKRVREHTNQTNMQLQYL